MGTEMRLLPRTSIPRRQPFSRWRKQNLKTPVSLNCSRSCKLLEGRGRPAIFIIALPPPNTIGGPALIISLQVYSAAPERQRPARRGHDDGGGFVKTKMGICREKKERSDCYCVYIEREDIRDSILEKTCTLNNCFAEMLLICSFAPATLPQPV
ncbi:uncharacterized protein LOC117977895 isoform X3 [Pan paniscus]|uniref:uncharacterized protein LOC117977895 isoform X3 n=1 Tax=Pan paniscus TaxID=9597 RepID=UPI003005FA21